MKRYSCALASYKKIHNDIDILVSHNINIWANSEDEAKGKYISYCDKQNSPNGYKILTKSISVQEIAGN
jgi:hypothetical protein